MGNKNPGYLLAYCYYARGLTCGADRYTRNSFQALCSCFWYGSSEKTEQVF